MTYDYIFTGAGAAGLSLVSKMAKDPFFADKSILLIDASDKKSNDRTWCFWSYSDLGFKSAQEIKWDKLSFKTDQFLKTDPIQPYQYYHINGLNFYQEIKKEICPKDNITWTQEEVLSISHQDGLAKVRTKNTSYEGSYVFNSVFGLANHQIAKPKIWQHFYGLSIKTEQPFFRNHEAMLMDFSISPNNQHVQFGYMLPFNDHEALVEFTEFSGRTIDDETYLTLVHQYLKDLGITDFEILEHEKGKIPMSMATLERQEHQIYHIGTVGGMTKPTTGYTFSNIQKDSDLIIEGLKKGKLKLSARSKARFTFYDRLLLGIIDDDPSKVKDIMSKLFKRNQMKHILKFLDERTSLLEEIRIFLTIPWAPFLRQLIKK
jgi:lycopene beta-cyclase